MEEIPDVTPNYRASVVGGDTILDLRADVCPADAIYFFFYFDFEDEEHKDKFLSRHFDISYFASAWSRGLLCNVISNLRCSDRCRELLLVWLETIYYHMDYVVRRLRVPGSSAALREGAFFKIDLAPTSPQAIAKLGLPADCCGAGPMGGNLLERVDGDSSDWKDGGCSVCLGEFEDERRGGGRGEELTRMPCSHAFHYNCLAEWLPKSKTCPLCGYRLKWKTFVLQH